MGGRLGVNWSTVVLVLEEYGLSFVEIVSELLLGNVTSNYSTYPDLTSYHNIYPKSTYTC